MRWTGDVKEHAGKESAAPHGRKALSILPAGTPHPRMFNRSGIQFHRLGQSLGGPETSGGSERKPLPCPRSKYRQGSYLTQQQFSPKKERRQEAHGGSLKQPSKGMTLKTDLRPRPKDEVLALVIRWGKPLMRPGRARYRRRQRKRRCGRGIAVLGPRLGRLALTEVCGLRVRNCSSSEMPVVSPRQSLAVAGGVLEQTPAQMAPCEGAVPNRSRIKLLSEGIDLGNESAFGVDENHAVAVFQGKKSAVYSSVLET